MRAVEEEASAYRIKKIHGLVFMDGKEAPLTRRCGLRKSVVSAEKSSCGKGRKGLTRAKEPAFLSEASIL